GFGNSVESVWDFQFFQAETGQLHKGVAAQSQYCIPQMNKEVIVEKALDSFFNGAPHGSTLATVNAGLVYWEIGKKDEGVRMYKRAAELNDPAGQCNLRISYLQGSLKMAERIQSSLEARV
nr:hypothetical protein [Tanacetum cinerariifolium]